MCLLDALIMQTILAEYQHNPPVLPDAAVASTATIGPRGISLRGISLGGISPGVAAPSAIAGRLLQAWGSTLNRRRHSRISALARSRR